MVSDWFKSLSSVQFSIMKIALIGGNGFIGSHLALALSKSGHQLSVADQIITPKWGQPQESIRYELCDWTQKESVEPFIAEYKPEIVIHLASHLLPGSDHAEVLYSSELKAQKQLLQVLQHYVIPKLLYFSSGGTIYGNNGLSIHSETDQARPISLYGSLKLETEALITRAHQDWALNYLILRPSNVYGVGQSLNSIQGLIAVAMGCIKENKPMTIWGDGSTVRDYLYIDDLVQAIQGLIEEKIDNEIFNVGTKRGYSVQTVLNLIEEITNTTLQKQYQPAREIDVEKNILDTTKLRQMIRWRPRISLREGIARFWKSLP